MSELLILKNLYKIYLYIFFRAQETFEAAERRRSADNVARKNKLQAMSPASKEKHREKDRKRKSLQREEKRKCGKAMPKIKVLGKKQIQPIVEDPAPKILTYEDIRERNIAERKKLLQDLKIDQLKLAATAVHGNAKKE